MLNCFLIINKFILFLLFHFFQALNVAEETYIRINSDGIMCIQQKVVSKKKNETFLDFFMIPEENFDHENIPRKLGEEEGGAR